MVSKKKLEENKLIGKITNPFQLVAYIFTAILRYKKMKETLFALFLVSIMLIILQNNGISINEIIESIFGGKK